MDDSCSTNKTGLEIFPTRRMIISFICIQSIDYFFFFILRIYSSHIFEHTFYVLNRIINYSKRFRFRPQPGTKPFQRKIRSIYFHQSSFSTIQSASIAGRKKREHVKSEGARFSNDLQVSRNLANSTEIG